MRAFVCCGSVSFASLRGWWGDYAYVVRHLVLDADVLCLEECLEGLLFLAREEGG